MAARLRWELAAIGCALLGVVLRCLPWRGVFGSDGTIFLDVDPYYHLRRAALIVEQFPTLPKFDAWIGFPTGASIPWPPGFDLLLALPGLFGASRAATETWAALLPPLLGGVAVYLVYRVGRLLIDPVTGLLAALLFALLPGAAESALLGRADHHALVAPVVLGMYSALIVCLRATSPRRALAWGVGCGALTAYAVASWIVTPPLYFAPLPLLLLILGWSAATRELRRAAWSGIGGAAVLVVLAVLVVGDLERKPFDLYQPSLFTCIPFALAGAVVLLGMGHPRRLLVAALAVCALLALAVALWPALRAPIAEAWGVLVNRDPSYQLPIESRSPLFHEDWFTLDRLVRDYSYLGLLLPAAWIAFVVGRGLGSRDRAATLLLAIWGGLALLLQLLQQRFIEYAASAWCLLLAWAIVAGGRWLRRSLAGAPRPGRGRLLSVVLTVCLLATLTPLVAGWRALADPALAAPPRQLHRFARELTPLLAPATDAAGAPAYGFLAGWNDAHPLLYLTGRATLVSSFGTAEATAINGIGFAMLLAPSESWAVQRLQQQRLRYVVVTSPVGQVASMTRLAAAPVPELEQLSSERDGTVTSWLLPTYDATLHARLFLGDGASSAIADHQLAPLAHFRLLLEATDDTAVGNVVVASRKAFEVVAGAQLVGSAEPGARCTAELTLRTNRGRSVHYAIDAVADSSGNFELVVPYPTASWGAPVVPLGPYLVSCGDRSGALDVSEEAVQQATAITVPWPANRSP